MRKILIITSYIEFPWEKGNHRYCYLADLLSETYDVEIITSDFVHTRKAHRPVKGSDTYKISLLHEPGYKNNISIMRVISHKVFENRVGKYLKKCKKPDLIYIGVPPIGLAKKIIRFALKENVKTIIDVQDMWPEGFEFVFHFVKWRIFNFLRNDADYVYRNAEKVIAVSDTYINRAMRVRNRKDKGTAVFLGTDMHMFDGLAKQVKNKHDGKVHIVYVGTIGASYDLKLLIDSVAALPGEVRGLIVCEFLGSGPDLEELQRYSDKKKISAVYYGRIPYEDMVKKLVQCDIAVNLIKYGTMQSIINKVGDYAMAGLPVINTQNNDEYRELIDTYHCGINCTNGSAEEVSAAILKLTIDKDYRIELGKNNRRLGEELFDRAKTYPAIVETINSMIDEE